MDKSPPEEIVVDPLSFRDENGRIFRIKDQVYRAIFHENELLYRNLFDQGIIQDLTQKQLLIETEISSLEVEDYNLILKHRTIPFVAYPHEWCSDMFKDATLLHIDLTLELCHYNLTIWDANPLNIIFDGSQPVFIDFCSIVPVKNNFYWPGKTSRKFNFAFIHFLKIMQHNYVNLARKLLMHSYGTKPDLIQEQLEAFRHCYSDKGMSLTWSKIMKQAKSYIPSNIRPFAKQKIMSVKNRTQDQESCLSFLRQLRREVEGIQIPRFKKNHLISYDNFFASLAPSSEWTTKQKSVHNILSEFKPKSVLDMDSDEGWYAQLAAHCGSQVVAFDDDEACVQKLYKDARKNSLYIVPLAIDWTGRDVNLSSEFITSPNQRIKCDFVIALTIVHHLIFKRKLGFENILNQLFQFCQRWLLVEFIPYPELAQLLPTNHHPAREWLEKTSWYTLEQFVDLFKCQFPQVQVFPSYPASRSLLLFDKLSV